MSVPLGIRQNNPGNIERNGIPWKGLNLDADGRFCTFENIEYGIRAAAIILSNYYRKHKILTIRQAIARWAPKNENNTALYVANVAKWSGLPADWPIKLDAAETLVKLLPAMFRMENGQNNGKPWVDAATIERGVAMAVNDRK
jgi:hypothetical protein